MNNNVSNQKHYNVYYPSLMSDKPPFATSSIQIPNEILKHNFVSYLSFYEQSHSLALVSKAFNALATFAREEQDWKDHTVDATIMRYSSNCFEDKRDLLLRDYIKWQNSKPMDKSIDFSSSFLYLEIFNKKIHFINKIVNLFGESLREFILALPTAKQTKIKQIALDIDIKDDFSFEQLSNKCQGVELFEIGHDPDLAQENKHFVQSMQGSNYGQFIFPTQKGFVHFLQKCKQVKLNFEQISIVEVDFLTKSITKCISLDPNFIFPLNSIKTYYLPLDEKFNPILEHSNNLIHFEYRGDDNIITENFINALACCTRLESIDISGYGLKFHSNNPEGIITSHDQAFAHLFRSCTFLRTFAYVSPIGLGDYSFRSLCCHPRIQNVNISMVLSPKIFESHFQCLSLIRFKLDILDFSHDGCTRDYNGLSKLGFRTLESVSIVTKAVATFFPNLEEFEIVNKWINWNYNPKLTEEAYLALSSLSDLRKLDFNYIFDAPSQTALISFANHPKLESLKFKLDNRDNTGNQILSSYMISSLEEFLKEKFKEVKNNSHNKVSPDFECIPTTKRNSIN